MKSGGGQRKAETKRASDRVNGSARGEVRGRWEESAELSMFKIRHCAERRAEGKRTQTCSCVHEYKGATYHPSTT